ncbi:MAG: hypothetical protein UU08_C0014G0011 [Candidatus Uhrbacteria bacterium GW2011_GWE2_40_58]|nr:MAG: hypothetical protein UT94_C0013G0017 [Candidatus Uhrbacteria bacterium GW2011_GWF2_40_263]KKR67554.1 MAG: hypothetical protein UU08_C0014G0011 [Candidatus Uhrbacteria bacterium GW2011_GWE2_40_58]OGL96485.1 MAG: hypothetical protein A2332_04880 [Candidatus Uhrbacteria bacterium RIFOXYB2_FULL_41_18]HBK34584.1 hypothetical protein [Candidatus Uhrbacteria bacterium]HCB55377.1 hypothetical protein [Candidatus Uhrbacteria bacterium]
MILFHSKKKQYEHRRDFFIDLFGWYGVLAIISAYGLNSFGLIEPSSLWYQGLNMSGSLGILVDAYAARIYQPVALNAIWMVIALIAILRSVIL